MLPTSKLTQFLFYKLCGWNTIYEQKLIKNLLTTFGDGETLSTLLGIRDSVDSSGDTAHFGIV